MLSPMTSRFPAPVLCALAAYALSWHGLTAADPMLGADGPVLRDGHGHGQPVQLRGVNLGGWLKFEEWMCPSDASKTLRDDNPGHNGYDVEVRRLLTTRFGAASAAQLLDAYEDTWITAVDLDHIKELGLNAVRLPFAYSTLKNLDGSWRADAFARLDWLVAQAWSRGIYTILDFHAFLPPAASQDGSASGYFADAAQQAETEQIWSRIAEHYAGNPAIAFYDLLNEPNNSYLKPKAPAHAGQAPSAATVCALYDRLYHALRMVDREHAIAMEGLWDWRSLRNPAEAGYGNVVYSLHWYHWGNKKPGALNADSDHDLADALQLRTTWKVPCYVGEFNLFGDQDAWRHALAGYDAAGVSWTLWSYKAIASGDNSWGVYTTRPGKVPRIPNLATDSAEAIRSAWQGWATTSDSYALNPMLGPVLKPVR
jgi:hypothetical protein